ncbi:GIY-YIG nuclease family protein [Desulfohalobiaceae bacterium Ax17]|nr:GIY-YIG nuclease family protein [Desulfovulcanus ferrireducens]
MTNKNNTVLYTGICNDLQRRVCEHKNKVKPNSFTARYSINKLVYYEFYEDINLAIAREKQIKSGSRAKKIALIEKENKRVEGSLSGLVLGDCFAPLRSARNDMGEIDIARGAKLPVAILTNG